MRGTSTTAGICSATLNASRRAAWEKIVYMPTAYDEIPYANLPFAQALPRGHATDRDAARARRRPTRARRACWSSAAAPARTSRASRPPTPSVRRRRRRPRGDRDRGRARRPPRPAGLDNVRFDVGDVLELTDGRARRVRLRDRARALRVGAASRCARRCSRRAAAHLAPRRDRLPLLHRASRRAHAPDAARDGAVARARRWRTRCERAERARAAVRAARPARRGRAGRRSTRASSARTCTRSPTAPDAMLVHDLLGRDLRARVVHGLRGGGRAPRAGLRRRRARRRAAASRRGRAAVEAFVDEAAGDDRIAREQYFDLLVLRRFRQLAGLPRRPRARRPRVDPRGGPAAARRAGRRRGRAAGAAARGARRRRAAAADRVRRVARARSACRPAELAEAARRRASTPARSSSTSSRRPRPPRPASARARARSRAAQARPGALVTTLLNQVVRITDEPTGALLRLLDGTRDREAILEAFPGALDRAVARRGAGEVRGAGAAVRVTDERQRRLGRGGFGGVGGGRVCSLRRNNSTKRAHPASERRGTPHPLLNAQFAVSSPSAPARSARGSARSRSASVSRPCLPNSCATARMRWRIVIELPRRRPGTRPPASSCGSRRRRA